MLTCTYVLATLADDDNFQPSLKTQPQQTNEKSQPVPSVPPSGLLHSTQNENGNIEADMPDISTIPHPEPEVQSGSFEEPTEIEGSPPAKKMTHLFRYCLDMTDLSVLKLSFQALFQLNLAPQQGPWKPASIGSRLRWRGYELGFGERK